MSSVDKPSWSALGWSLEAEIISPSLKEKKGYILPGKVMHMAYEKCREDHIAGLSVIMPKTPLVVMKLQIDQKEN